MELFLSREQVRQLDRRAIQEFGVPGVVLMENAGRGAAELLVSLGIHGRVLIACGKGNNGGDGFVIARHLGNRGFDPHTIVFVRPDELGGDAVINYRILERGQYPLQVVLDPEGDVFTKELAAAEWVVDALFGTGLSGPVRPPFDKIIEKINARQARVLAVDIPSGLDCDTGMPMGATVRASHTVTFVAEKLGFKSPTAVQWLGKVHVVDIGMPRILLDRPWHKGSE
jgi:NAD(P)H-hydrate epimerase